VGALYRVHGLNNYYQARCLIDLVRLREIIRECGICAAKREVFKLLYSINIREVGQEPRLFEKSSDFFKVRPNHPLKKLYYHYVCVGAFLLRS